MDRTRWLITAALALAPMLGSMALQPPASSVLPGARPILLAAAGFGAGRNGASKSGSKSGSNSSSNTSSSSTSNSSSSSAPGGSSTSNSGNSGTNSSGGSNSGSSSTSGAGAVVSVPQAKVTNPHGPLNTPCANCHTYTSWKPIRSNPEFNHDLTGYPLRGMHENVACTKCHTSLIFKNVSTQCADCHADIHRRQFGANCESCHSVKGWNVSMDAIKNHQNRFPLTGAHALVECEECHKNAASGQFAGLSTACYTCHQQDFRTPVVNHVGLGFPTTCESCHNVDSWFNAKFDHLKYTGYALTGAHATLECTACHINNVFAGTPASCYGCHSADYLNSNNPPHVQLGLPRDCSTCHTTTDWLNAKFDHTLYAHYPLTGGHANVGCQQCHANNTYVNTPTACYSCHKADYNGTTNPNHVQAGFPTDCSICHTITVWTTATFNHNTTSFPLTGAHVNVACAQCHVSGNYSGSLPQNCYGCHQADYKGAANPNHVSANFPTACETCHTTTSWNGATFNHNNTPFPLTGAHVTVPCASCHVNNVFAGTPTDCYACHKADFTGTTNPNHVQANFPTACVQCHNTTAWTGAAFNHNNTPFPLTGAHVNVPCASCHVNNVFAGTPTDCYACHTKDFTGTTNPNHVSSGFPTSCTLCHNTAAWSPSTFNHASVFPLTGAHATLGCAQCHTNNNYTTVPADCYSCHKADFTGTTNPNHVSAGFPTACATCHNTTSWTGAVFNHNNTPFPLTGAHVTVPCASCHVNNVFAGTPTDCYSCHKADFTGTTNPNHVTAGFPTACVQCHNTTAWTGAVFNHNNTPFPLTGAHVNVPCASCHVNNVFAGTPTDCYSCHTKDFTGTTNPNHVSSGFPTNCTLCHTTTAWTPSTFNHASVFPLTGAHATTACAACHTNNNYTTLPTNCYGCHQTDYNGTNNPPHMASGFPTTCDTCHSTTNWLGAVFDHSKTTFPLTGAHVSVPCASCHTNNNYTTLPTACYGCHQSDFTGTTNPAHVAGGFPTDCTLCHSTANWTTSTFNHASVFPLVGFHATVACASCHKNNNYTTVPTNCYGCHQADFTGTANPSHVAAAFPTTCDTCHTQNDWTVTGMNFNHTLYANYALTGFHASLTCVQCHTNGNFNNLSTACYSCHQSDFTGTTNPAHVAAGFPTDCSICHSTTNWTSSTFNHSTTTFPLTGFHATMQCVQCHTSATTYNGSLPTACYGCHQADYTGTTNPAHAAAGFPTTCDTCHTTTNWSGATFNHNNTPFPLTGFHVNVACNLCHINNVFAGTPTDCYSCHTKDYTGTTNPNHTTAGWPTTCVTCHTTTAWIPATLPTSYHTFFNLSHGNANGVCTTCHTNSSDYSVFQCTGCHGGNNAANFNHPNVNGYVYNSVNCYACHTKG